MPISEGKLEAKNLRLLSAIYRRVFLLGLGLVGFVSIIKMSALDLLSNWSLALQHGHQICSGKMQMFSGIRQTNKTHLLQSYIQGLQAHLLELGYLLVLLVTNLRLNGRMQMLTGVMLVEPCTKVYQLHKSIFQLIKLHLQKHKVCGRAILVTGRQQH